MAAVCENWDLSAFTLGSWPISQAQWVLAIGPKHPGPVPWTLACPGRVLRAFSPLTPPTPTSAHSPSSSGSLHLVYFSPCVLLKSSSASTPSPSPSPPPSLSSLLLLSLLSLPTHSFSSHLSPLLLLSSCYSSPIFQRTVSREQAQFLRPAPPSPQLFPPGGLSGRWPLSASRACTLQHAQEVTHKDKGHHRSHTGQGYHRALPSSVGGKQGSLKFTAEETLEIHFLASEPIATPVNTNNIACLLFKIIYY